MPQACAICGRGTVTSFSVSHSKIKTKTKQKINLQSKKIFGQKERVCTRCIKSMAKETAK